MVRLAFVIMMPGVPMKMNQALVWFYPNYNYSICHHIFSLFFYNLLPEGSNKQVVCKLNRIDRNDYFGLLLTTAKNDSIGAVRVIEIAQEV